MAQEEQTVSGSDWLVLVVEDEAPIRRFLKTALEAQGFKMLEAPTGDPSHGHGRVP